MKSVMSAAFISSKRHWVFDLCP